MSRFSEQQARLGAFVGNGVNFVASKTALSRSQWLMLVSFAIGAVIVGFFSTHHFSPRSSSTETSVARQAPTAPVDATHGFSHAQQASGASRGASAQDPQPGSAGPLLSTPIAMPSSASKPDIAGSTEQRSAPSVEPETRSLLEGLAKDVARINQKIDDLAGKQRQTADRLAVFIADSKPRRSRSIDGADRPEHSGFTSRASKASPSALTDELTVHPRRRRAQRPTEAARERRAVEADKIERRTKAAERKHRIRRRFLSGEFFGRRF